jgi:hypothetical protein
MVEENEFPAVTFYPKRWTAIACVVGCAAGITGVIWMWNWTPWEALFLIFCVFIFLASIVRLIPGSSFLYLEESGFTFCTLFRKNRFLWTEIEKFYVVQVSKTGIKAGSFVGFNFDPASNRAKIGRRAAKFLSQCEGALPESYGMKPEELCELMNQYLVHAKGSQDESS